MKKSRWRRNWRKVLRGAGITFALSLGSLGSAQAAEVEVQENKRTVITPAVQTEIIEEPKSTELRAPRSTEAETSSTLLVGTDRFSAAPQLNLTLRSDGEKNFPVDIFLYSNYEEFIETTTIKVYTDPNIRRSEPVKEIAISQFNSSLPIHWDGKFSDGNQADYNQNYWLVLEVTDQSGSVDRTLPVEFRANRQQKDHTFLRSEEKEPLIPGWGESRRDDFESKINLPGEAMVIRGKLTESSETVWVNGKQIPVNSDGTYEMVVFSAPSSPSLKREIVDAEGNLVSGDQEITDSYIVEIKDAQGNILKSYMEARSEDDSLAGSLDSGDIFYVGLVDFTMGKRAGVEPAQSGKYPDKTYYEGRVAFYLRGHIKGKYLLTAQMDTGELETKDIFRKLGEREREELVQYIRPEDYYPVYGDGSTIEDTVDSDGKFFVRLQWDLNELKWGNFSTGEGMPDLANYSRTLYGARLKMEGNEKTKFGKSRYFLSAYGANSDSTYERNEFLSTGGTLYYLNHKGVRDGSDKIALEVRDSTTQRVIGTVPMSRGSDYDLDTYNGRIMLSKPIPLLAGSLMTSNSDAYLVVDYEYDENQFWDSNNNNYGIRGSGWINDYIRIGGTYAKEGRSDGDYKLGSGDGEIRFGQNSFVKGEYATSESSLGDVFRSGDGGISFQMDSGWDGTGKRPDGKAWRAELEVDAKDFGIKSDLKFRSYYQKRDAGFSSVADQTDNETKEHMEELLWTDPKAGHNLVLRNSYYHELDDEKEKKQQVVYTHHWNKSFRTSLELRQRDYWDYIDKTREKDLLGAIRLEKDLTDKTTVYAGQRVTLDKDYDAEGRNRTLLGAIHRFSPAVTLQAEGFWGQDGNGGSVQINGGAGSTTVYSRYWTDVEDDSDRVAGYGVGIAHDLSQRVSVYVENQNKRYLDDDKSEKGQVYGFRYRFSQRQSVELNYSQSELTQDRTLGTQNKTDRSVWSMGYQYQSDKGFKGSARFEQRDDKSSSENTRQYVIKGKAEYDGHPDWQWYGETEMSRTRDHYKSGDSAKYNKTTFGVAYRPTKHDKWNFLAKYTWLDNQDPDESSNSWDFMEKSQVASFEGIFQPVQQWQISAKVAKKWGWYEDGSDNYSSSAFLWGLRLQYQGWKHWEPFVEYRKLRVAYGQENVKDGFMVGMYRHLGGGFRVGAGYNFTSFNDDLTDLDQKREGWFFNVTLVK